MKHKLHYLTVLLCFAMFTAKAQDRTASGTVISSEDDSSVPGVNVVVLYIFPTLWTDTN